jgi:hypothetical protein
MPAALFGLCQRGKINSWIWRKLCAAKSRDAGHAAKQMIGDDVDLFRRRQRLATWVVRQLRQIVADVGFRIPSTGFGLVLDMVFPFFVPRRPSPGLTES